jgi:hypothetical protein
MPSAVWDLGVNPARALVGPVTPLSDVPHASGRTGAWEFDVDEGRHLRLRHERSTASLLQTCRAQIDEGRIDPTGSHVSFAFHVFERLSAIAMDETLVTAVELGSINVTYQMPVIRFEPQRAPRAEPRFHELSGAQQSALVKHFRSLRPLSPQEIERRRAHLREAETFFREG